MTNHHSYMNDEHACIYVTDTQYIHYIYRLSHASSQKASIPTGHFSSLHITHTNHTQHTQALARIIPKSFHPHWALLLPSDQKRPGYQSLLGIIAGDHSGKLRSAAAVALQALLQRSRTYLSVSFAFIIGIYVFVCVCMYVCMYIYVCVCIYIYTYMCMFLCMSPSLISGMYVCEFAAV
jgi:hypothetical protein